MVQLWAGVYAYYTAVGVTTAGYPLMDTQNCPFFDLGNTCTYDFFDKGYALFAYTSPLPGGQSLAITGGYYTGHPEQTFLWFSLGFCFAYWKLAEAPVEGRVRKPFGIGVRAAPRKPGTGLTSRR